MKKVPLIVKDETGAIREVATITNNEDHVGNRIAEGHLGEEDRWRETARLYRVQLSAMHREKIALRDRLMTRIDEMQARLDASAAGQPTQPCPDADAAGRHGADAPPETGGCPEGDQMTVKLKEASAEGAFASMMRALVETTGKTEADIMAGDLQVALVDYGAGKQVVRKASDFVEVAR